MRHRRAPAERPGYSATGADAYPERRTIRARSAAPWIAIDRRCALEARPTCLGGPELRLGVPRAVIGLGALVLALAGAAAFVVGRGSAGASRRATSPFALGGERLRRWRSAYLRAGARRGGAATARLAAFFPDFSPAGDFERRDRQSRPRRSLRPHRFRDAEARRFRLDPAERTARPLPALPRRDLLEPSRRADRARLPVTAARSTATNSTTSRPTGANSPPAAGAPTPSARRPTPALTTSGSATSTSRCVSRPGCSPQWVELRGGAERAA